MLTEHRAPDDHAPWRSSPLPSPSQGYSTLSPNPYPQIPRADLVRDRGCSMSLIAEELTAALHAALAAAGLPEPKKVEVAPTSNREHGDFQSNVALGLQKQVGARGTEIAQRIARELERHRRRTSSGSRSPARVPQLLPLADVAARRARDGRRGGRRLRARRHLPGPAHQPRVRLGQPHRPAPRRRRALGRGRRRDRQPARGAGRRGAPRVLPERRRQPARDVRRLAVRPLHGSARRPRTATRASTSSRWRSGCGPSWATPSPEEAAREWGHHDVVAQLQGRPRPHRRALRHLVLRAHAARARARSARCSSA